MSRERNRIIQNRESNPIVECNKIQKKLYPGLLAKFDQVKDPRHSSYTQYSCREIIKQDCESKAFERLAEK